MKSNFICFLSALRFLTILPVTWYSDRDHHYFSRCVIFFTVIGLLIGGGGMAIAWLVQGLMSPFLSACFLLLYLAGISKFLHLDGLADTADGFFSSRPKETILEIMHDSRTGAMGVIVLIIVLLFKFVSLATLPVSVLPWVVLLIPTAGRTAIVISMAYLPYARREGGLGKTFYPESKGHVPLVSLLLVGVAGFWVSFTFGFLALIITLITALLFGLWTKKMIGGTTGDTLGAICEITETTVAIASSIFFNLNII